MLATDTCLTAVMDQGRVAEFGSPAELLAKKDGVFSGMVAATGEGNRRHLTELATQAARAKGADGPTAPFTTIAGATADSAAAAAAAADSAVAAVDSSDVSPSL